MGRINMSEVQKMAEDAKKSGFAGGNWDSLKDGRNVRRILFPKGDSTKFCVDAQFHFGLGAEGKGSVACLKNWNKRCPICEEVEQLQHSRSKDDQELAKRLRATQRIFINVIDRDGEDEKPKILAIGRTIYRQILDLIIDPDYADITDPDHGHDVTIIREGKGLQTKYTVNPKPKETVASETYTEAELDSLMTDLNSLVVEHSYEDLVKLLNGEDISKKSYSSDDEDEDESEDEAPDYDELSKGELIDLCEEKGIDVPAGANRMKLITLLTKAASKGSSKGASKAADNYPPDDDDVPFDMGTPIRKEPTKREPAPEVTGDPDDDILDDIDKALAARRAARKSNG